MKLRTQGKRLPWFAACLAARRHVPKGLLKGQKDEQAIQVLETTSSNARRPKELKAQ